VLKPISLFGCKTGSSGGGTLKDLAERKSYEVYTGGIKERKRLVGTGV